MSLTSISPDLCQRRSTDTKERRGRCLKCGWFCEDTFTKPKAGRGSGCQSGVCTGRGLVQRDPLLYELCSTRLPWKVVFVHLVKVVIAGLIVWFLSPILRLTGQGVGDAYYFISFSYLDQLLPCCFWSRHGAPLRLTTLFLRWTSDNKNLT